MDTLIIGVGALILGFLLAWLLVYSSLKSRFEIQFQERLRESNENVKKETLKRSSATLKGQIGERFAPFVPGFKYEPADARFLGSPVDYVVFDGMANGHIRRVAFVEVKVGALPLTPFQKQVSEAIRGGRSDWRIVKLSE